MVSALSILLFGCWLAGRSGVSGEGSLPKPSISVSPGEVIPVGGNVTIQCWLQQLGMRILFYKDGDGNQLTYTDPVGYVAEFPITSARQEQSGNYTCRYSHRTGPAAYSEPSDPVQIIVAELIFPKPSISLSPSGEVSLWGDVTLRCQGQHQGMRFVLNKERRHFPPVDSDGFEAVFPISNVQRDLGGSYSCSYHSRSEPFAGSYSSDPVELVVRGREFLKPTIWVSPSRVMVLGGNVTIRCAGLYPGMEFFLRKAGHPNQQAQLVRDGTVAEFPIPSVSREDGGSYTCEYRSITDQSRWSHLSDPVEIIVAGGTNSTQPGAAPAPTRPGIVAPGGSEALAPLGLTSSILAGVSAAAAVLLLLLLLLVAFVCFRKTRARKGAAPRPSSTSPMVALEVPAQQDPIYTSVDEGKESQTLEPDPGADGLTYAELDGQVLQAKRGGLAPAPEPTQPSVYATINVSRGPPQ